MSVEAIAAFCFGSVVGWVTNRTLGKTVALSSIAAVVGAIGGAAAAGAIGDDTSFAWYSIGLCCLFFTRLIVTRTMMLSTHEWLGDDAGGTVATTDVIVVSKGDLSRLETISAPVRGILKPALETARTVTEWLGRISRAEVVLKAPRGTSSELESVGDEEFGIEPKRQPRFANATVRDLNDQRLAEQSSLRPFELVKLQLDIGPRSAESHVGDEVPFPDEVVPQGRQHRRHGQQHRLHNRNARRQRCGSLDWEHRVWPFFSTSRWKRRNCSGRRHQPLVHPHSTRTCRERRVAASGTRVQTY